VGDVGAYYGEPFTDEGTMDPKNPADRVKFLLLGIAFLVSEGVLSSIILPKWGPTVGFLAGLIPLFFFGWLAGLLKPKSTQSEEPPDNAKYVTALNIIFGIAWVVGMVSWFPGAEIEAAALKQPNHPTAEYTEPMHLKGVVRYVTPTQAEISEITRWTFLGGCLVGFGAGLLGNRLKKKKTTAP
jgi:hypothetical protein